MTTITFPSGFLWGAATAAHQVEGNNIASDLWEKEYAPETTIKEPSGDACDSYNRFEEDIQLLADAELNTYRFSLEWARIEPVQGVISNAQLLHYRRMIEACQNRGVEPFVTLHHFSNPAWFTHNGGWKAGDAVELFLKYVETVKPILKGGWCCFVGLVIDSITTNHATRPSSRRRSMMLMPNSVLILLSRYQTMYSSSMPMNSSMVTPAKLRLWKNSCLRRPKNPSAAALSGEQPFALIERVRLLSLQMRIHSGHR